MEPWFGLLHVEFNCNIYMYDAIVCPFLRKRKENKEKVIEKAKCTVFNYVQVSLYPSDLQVV